MNALHRSPISIAARRATRARARPPRIFEVFDHLGVADSGVAKFVGVTPQAVHAWRARNKAPSTARAFELAELGVMTAVYAATVVFTDRLYRAFARDVGTEVAEAYRGEVLVALDLLDLSVLPKRYRFRKRGASRIASPEELAALHRDGEFEDHRRAIEFAYFTRRWRLAAGIAQDELADLTGIARSRVAALEKFEARLTDDEYDRLRKFTAAWQRARRNDKARTKSPRDLALVAAGRDSETRP